MPTIEVQVRRFSVVSSRPFEEIEGNAVRSCFLLNRDHGTRRKEKGKKQDLTLEVRRPHFNPHHNSGME